MSRIHVCGKLIWKSLKTDRILRMAVSPFRETDNVV